MTYGVSMRPIKIKVNCSIVKKKIMKYRIIAFSLGKE